MGRLESTLRTLYARSFGERKVASLRRRGLRAGHSLNLMMGATIDPSHCHHITIGDNVTLSRDVLILAHDASTKQYLGATRIARVTIGDRVFIGAKAVVLPGVHIGDDVIVGAGSVVTRDIPAGTVVAGVPAKPIATLAEWTERRRAEFESAPHFGRELSAAGGATPAMLAQMDDELGDGPGYIG